MVILADQLEEAQCEKCEGAIPPRYKVTTVHEGVWRALQRRMDTLDGGVASDVRRLVWTNFTGGSR